MLVRHNGRVVQLQQQLSWTPTWNAWVSGKAPATAFPSCTSDLVLPIARWPGCHHPDIMPKAAFMQRQLSFPGCPYCHGNLMLHTSHTIVCPVVDYIDAYIGSTR